MGDTTGIEWTEATWNPWHGCTQVSPGCAHCYMFRQKRRYGQDPQLVVRSKTKFDEPLRWPDGRMIFTCSWSDWFHEAADPWREEAWDIVRRCPQHTFQILTKRADRIAEQLPDDWGDGYPNVWLGVSVENQRHTHRAAILTGIPARVRFVSAEPLLGPVRLDTIAQRASGAMVIPICRLDWLIIGGESGPRCRSMDLEWARALIQQCRDVSSCAPFVKQLGGWPNKRGEPDVWPEDLRVREMPRA